MLIAIDVGNSNIKFAIYDGDKIIGKFLVITDKKSSSEEIKNSIDKNFVLLNLNLIDVKYVILSSVVPAMVDKIKHAVKDIFSVEPFIIKSNEQIKIKNLYESPEQTGADRLINAVAAVKKYGVPIIIIDMGTATTFDAVNKKGEFIGGAIFAGINTLSASLVAKTSKLPPFDFAKPENPIGKNTNECLQSGAFYGYIGAIEGIIKKMKPKVGRNVKIVATGGLSKKIAGYTKIIDVYDENLTIDGLKLVYDMSND